MTAYTLGGRLCRFCEASDHEDKLVKYGTRHYAHYACWLEARGRETDPAAWRNVASMIEAGLDTFSVRKFPVFVLGAYLRKHGHKDADRMALRIIAGALRGKRYRIASGR